MSNGLTRELNSLITVLGFAPLRVLICLKKVNIALLAFFCNCFLATSNEFDGLNVVTKISVLIASFYSDVAYFMFQKWLPSILTKNHNFGLFFAYR